MGSPETSHPDLCERHRERNRGPLTLLAQGVRIDDSQALNAVLGVVAAAISAPQPEPLSATEHQELRQAASS